MRATDRSSLQDIARNGGPGTTAAVSDSLGDGAAAAHLSPPATGAPDDGLRREGDSDASRDGPDEALLARLSRHARLAGLRSTRPLPTLEEVERRRSQLWVVTGVTLMAVSAAVAFLAVTEGGPLTGWLGGVGSAWVTPFAVVALSLALLAYVVDKERHLRRLATLLVSERELRAALAGQVRQLTAFLEAGQAVNTSLELGDVLDRLLDVVLELLEAASGTVFLADDGGALSAAATRGDLGGLGDGLAQRVAARREPVLVNGTVCAGDGDQREASAESGMAVPLLHREVAVGVLVVNSGRGRDGFSRFELRAMTAFGHQAAAAVANARLYDQERRRSAELRELAWLRDELLAAGAAGVSEESPSRAGYPPEAG